MGLMLLETNNAFRYFVVEFFPFKFFDDKFDKLDGKTVKKVSALKIKMMDKNQRKLFLLPLNKFVISKTTKLGNI